MAAISRRRLIQLVGAGTGVGVAVHHSRDAEPDTMTPVGGGSSTDDDSDDDPPVGSSGTAPEYQVDVATSIAAVPEPDVKPQLIFITSGSERGEYVNVDAGDLPIRLKLNGFEIAIADALSSVPARDSPMQIIFIRSGTNRGTHVNVESKPEENGDNVAEVAVADALADIEEPDKFPDLNWITGGAKGGYVNAGA